MRDHIRDETGVVLNLEIEPPVFVHPRLPNVLRFVILLRVQRRVTEIACQKLQLFIDRFLHRGGCIGDCVGCPVRENNRHYDDLRTAVFLRSRERDWRWAMVASAVLNGPWKRPLRMSSRPLAIPRSITCRCAVVYSSSTSGSFGRIVITRPDTLNSS